MPPRAEPAKSTNEHRLTSIAFALALTLVAGRLMMSEVLNSAADTTAGPRNISGPVTIIAMDVLCVLPAILILIRRLFDRTFTLSGTWSLLPLLLLSIWMTLSMRWAVNRFDALVSALTFTAAGAMLWAGLQLVRSWLRLRIVSAVCFGLLLVYVSQGVYFKLFEAPELRDYFAAHKSEILRDRQLAEGSPGAVMFEKKVLKAELMGFSVSPNTYAACIVLFMVVTLGAAIQRYVERDQAAWTVPIYGIGILLGAFILLLVESKAAAVSLVLAAVLFVGLRRYREKLGRHWKLTYLAGAAAIAAMVLAVAGHGLYHGTLPSSSLAFRWQYWVASARLLRDHPWHGVGWENFGLYYLHYRLPQAPEEIQDPHNFVIRFLIELGLIGGALALLWMARLWWELAHPLQPALDAVPMEKSSPRQIARAGVMLEYANPSASKQIPEAVKLFAAIGFAATILGFLGSTDLSSDVGYIILQFCQRMIFFMVFLIGSSLVGIESPSEPRLNERPAPWILYGLLIAVGLFLLQNLVDFSMFEIGPMFLLFFLIGAAMGLRTPEPRRNALGAVATIGGLILALAGCAVVLATIWPATARADELEQTALQSINSGKLPAALNLLEQADRAQPLNPLYLSLRAKFAAQLPGRHSPDPHILTMLADAIAKNPRDIALYRARIAYLRESTAPDETRISADFDKLIDLNPTDMQTRLEYADYLETSYKFDAARQQYREALRLNEKLDRNEPKRLENQPDGLAHLAQIRAKAE